MKKILFIALISCGCVHLPKETVLLSGEMRTMIAAAKNAHYAALDEYELQRLARIDDYLVSTYNTRFIKNMAKDGDLWGKTCKIANTTDSAIELYGFVDAAAGHLAAKRKELMDELAVTMKELREKVRSHYDILERSSQAVYMNLQSIRKNDEVMESTMGMVNINPEGLTPFKKISAKLDKAFK